MIELNEQISGALADQLIHTHLAEAAAAHPDHLQQPDQAHSHTGTGSQQLSEQHSSTHSAVADTPYSLGKVSKEAMLQARWDARVVLGGGVPRNSTRFQGGAVVEPLAIGLEGMSQAQAQAVVGGAQVSALNVWKSVID